MRCKLAAAPALAGAITIAAFLAPAAAQTPQAADQTLGMALLSATVAADGTLVASAGATAAVRNVAGDYTVTFGRSLAGCSCTASIGRANATTVVGSSGITANCPRDAPQPNDAGVIITQSGVATDTPFHLIAFCAR
jgi:hypothetical protein